jgi:hypothetical protein
MNIDLMTVVGPLIAIIAAAVIFLLILRRYDGKVDVFELGVLYAGIVFIYSVYPLLSYFAGGLSRLSNFILFQAQPLPGEVATISWLFFAYFVSFLAAYLLARGRSKFQRLRFPKPDPRLPLALMLLYASVEIFFLFMKLYYNIQKPEDYTDSYLLYANLPLIVKQLAGHLGGVELTLEVLLMAYLTLNYRKYRYIIFGWIMLEGLALSFYGIGARTAMFALLFSLLITYQFKVNRLKVRSAMILGFVGISLFLVLGILRSFPLNSQNLSMNPFAYPSEFESVFTNSYDLLHVKKAGLTAALFPSVYVNDFVALVPQQILPWQKLDPLDWYAQTFYPAFAARGGGLAFGAIPEAIVGFGWIDAAWRGAIVGLMLAFVHRSFVQGKKSFWRYCFYIWVCIFCYKCFRSTTFRLLPQFVYEFLTVFVVARAILLILPGRIKQDQPLQHLLRLRHPRMVNSCR